MKRQNSGFSVRARSVWLLAPAAAAIALLCGCQEYLDRRDTVTLGFGDAIEVNKATQTIDRWPHEARYDRWRSDGERARLAIERYRARKIPNPLKADKGGGSTTESTPTAQ